MKTETKIKKLKLNKETLRDLTAHHAGEVKGGGKSNGKACTNATHCSPTCGPTLCNLTSCMAPCNR